MSLVALIAALALADGRPAEAASPPPAAPCSEMRADIRVTGWPRPPLDVDPNAKVRLTGIVWGIYRPICSRRSVLLIDDQTGRRWRIELEPGQQVDLSAYGQEMSFEVLKARAPTCDPDCEALAIGYSMPTPSPPRWRLDGMTPMDLTGVITGIEERDGLTIAHVKAEDRDPWAVDLGPPAAMRLSKTGAPRPGARISLRGFRAADKSCAPECLVGARRFIVGGGTIKPTAEWPSPLKPKPGDKLLRVKGVINAVDFSEPRVRLHVTAEDGAHWLFEADTPTRMRREGNTRENLMQGGVVSITGFQPQSMDVRCEPECRATARNIYPIVPAPPRQPKG